MTPLHASYLGLSPAGFHRVAYVQWGQADSTEALVCVHGLTRTGRDFDDLAAALGERYRVVCPDVVGRGASDRLSDPAHYGFPQYLNDMTALIARLEVDQVDWVGTSMGGLIGMMLAAQPGSPIRRLVINDVGPFLPKAALERIAAYVGQDRRFADLEAAESYIRECYASFGPLTDAQWHKLTRDSFVGSEGVGFKRNYDPRIAEPFARAEAEDVDLWPVWDRIECPCLVLRGAHSDLLLAETAAEMQRRGPDVVLVEIADCGHAPALMAEEQIAIIETWLAR